MKKLSASSPTTCIPGPGLPRKDIRLQCPPEDHVAHVLLVKDHTEHAAKEKKANDKDK
ncbi:unnamed protein product, partial [Amoebophrya sp. A25]|eukprot:GSA25T00001477001.1